jgi:hypothetical protein
MFNDLEIFSKSGLVKFKLNQQLIGLISIYRTEADPERFILDVMQSHCAVVVQKLDLGIVVQDTWSSAP